MLTAEKFKDHLEEFIQISNNLKDGWFLDTVRGQTFARKKSVSKSKSNPVGVTEIATGEPKGTHAVDAFPACFSSSQNALLDEENIICEDDSSCMSPSTASVYNLSYEYHVVYSESYAVPVLYLNVLNPSGQRVSLDQVWDLCPESFQPYLHDNKWTTLTQQEHPLLGVPFLMLHPCHTADLMSQVTKTSGPGTANHMNTKGNYLVTWLSTVGPLVGLKLLDQYVLSLQQNKEPNKSKR